ncbi:hypothetical protein AHF37_04436 [Paragonimus kellicotti]|nr:hypothetical protein AHF37_04436 [Paragonimus kellicotti]
MYFAVGTTGLSPYKPLIAVDKEYSLRESKLITVGPACIARPVYRGPRSMSVSAIDRPRARQPAHDASTNLSALSLIWVTRSAPAFASTNRGSRVLDTRLRDWGVNSNTGYTQHTPSACDAVCGISHQLERLGLIIGRPLSLVCECLLSYHDVVF